MSALRKLASQSVRNIVRNGIKAPVMSRSMSSLIERKEHADEAKYIRNLEAARQAEIRANLDRILALEDHHEEKTGLVELLEKKENVGFMSKYGFNDWKYAVPLGLMFSMPMLINDILVIDAEAQLFVTFFMFASTVYIQGGGVVSSYFTGYSNDIEKGLRNVDDKIKSTLESAISANGTSLSIEEDFVEYNELKDSLKIVQAEVLTSQQAHNYREAIVKKLESLNALEESASHAIRQRMIKKVQSDVLETFKNDRKAKDNALNQAMAVLAAGANAKLGKDIVGELFSASLVNYKETYAKQPAGSDAILKKLEEDMAAIAAAPIVETKGGNVYITHPL